jgi:hypothetical protein
MGSEGAGKIENRVMNGCGVDRVEHYIWDNLNYM